MALRRPGHTQRNGSQPGDSVPWKFWAVVTIIVLLVAVGFTLYQKGVTSRVSTNAMTLCPEPSKIAGLTVILLDVSDALTPTQHLDIENRLQRLISEVPRHGLIQVFGARQGRGAVSDPDLELCNPGDERDVNELYQNPRMAKEKWKVFNQRLNAMLSDELHKPPSQNSPIFESIQAIGLKTFGKPEFDKQANRRLILVSDLMQNVAGGLSMYTDMPQFADFKKSRYYNTVRTVLSNVDVIALYLVRTPKQPWPQHPDFWNAYFADQGAKIVSLVPIHGAD